MESELRIEELDLPIILQHGDDDNLVPLARIGDQIVGEVGLLPTLLLGWVG